MEEIESFRKQFEEKEALVVSIGGQQRRIVEVMKFN